MTGGVISSAGVILAATFGVLMTQPLHRVIYVWFYGCTRDSTRYVSVRALLVPSVITLLRKASFWPSTVK